MIAAPVGADGGVGVSSQAGTVWLFLLGSTAAGITMGTIIGGVAAVVGLMPGVVGGVLTGLIMAVCLRGLYSEWRGKPSGLISRRWQVPREWRLFGPSVFATLMGYSMGLGWLTYVTFAGFYALVGIVIVQGSFVLGVAAFACYGVGRALPVLYYARDSRGRRPVGPLMFTDIGPRSEWLLRTRLVSLSSLATAAVARAFGG